MKKILSIFAIIFCLSIVAKSQVTIDLSKNTGYIYYMMGITSEGSNHFYVDGNRTDSYVENGSMLYPWKKIQTAMEYINSDASALALAGNYPASKYILHIAQGTYADSVVINNQKYLRWEMPGVIVSGKIDINTTQQTGDYYSKIEFFGGLSQFPEKGDNGELSGVISLTRNNDALQYISFSGIEVSNNMLFTNNGTWVVLANNSFWSNAAKFISGDFSGGGTPCVLLITRGQTVFESHIANTDGSATTVAMYDCIDTEFDLINSTMSYGGIFRNCLFTSNVTITTGTYKIDNVSWKQIAAQTHNLTGVTIQDLDDTFREDVNVGDDIIMKNGATIDNDSTTRLTFTEDTIYVDGDLYVTGTATFPAAIIDTITSHYIVVRDASNADSIVLYDDGTLSHLTSDNPITVHNFGNLTGRNLGYITNPLSGRIEIESDLRVTDSLYVDTCITTSIVHTDTVRASASTRLKLTDTTEFGGVLIFKTGSAIINNDRPTRLVIDEDTIYNDGVFQVNGESDFSDTIGTYLTASLPVYTNASGQLVTASATSFSDSLNTCHDTIKISVVDACSNLSIVSDTTDNNGALRFPDPGTNANSKPLIFVSDNAGTAQQSTIQGIYGANPYVRFSPSNAAGTPTAAADMRSDQMSFVDGFSLTTNTSDDDNVLFKAVDNDDNTLYEVARLTGASTPTFDLLAPRLTGDLNAAGQNIAWTNGSDINNDDADTLEFTESQFKFSGESNFADTIKIASLTASRFLALNASNEVITRDETDPIYAADSAKIIWFADSTGNYITPYDTLGKWLPATYSETDPVWISDSSDYFFKVDFADSLKNCHDTIRVSVVEACSPLRLNADTVYFSGEIYTPQTDSTYYGFKNGLKYNVDSNDVTNYRNVGYYLPYWKKDICDALYNDSSNAKLLIIGDSYASRYGNALKYEISKMYGYGGGYHTFFNNADYISRLPYYGEYVRLTTSGTWTNSYDISNADNWHSTYVESTTPADVYVMQGREWNRLKIFYRQTPGGGTFLVKINGATVGTINTDGVESGKWWYYTAGATTYTYSAEINITISSGIVRLYGFSLINEQAGRGIRYVETNVAPFGGCTIDDWILGKDTAAIHEFLDTLDVSLIGFVFLDNAGQDPATYGDSLIKMIKTVRPDIDVIVMTPHDDPGDLMRGHGERAMFEEMAKNNNVGYINFESLIGDYDELVASGVFEGAGGSHLKEAYTQVISREIIDRILPSESYTYDIQAQTINFQGSLLYNSENAYSYDASKSNLFISKAGEVTTGSNNTFIGYQAARRNTTGQENSAVGGNNLYNNISGRNNLAMGYNAGFGVTGESHSYCTFLGSRAGVYNENDYNTFIGYNSGQGVNGSNEGQYNTFAGANSGSVITTGSRNSLYGNSAGITLSTGAENTFLGSNVGGLTTTGAYNVFIGAYSGSTNVLGEQNVFIGHSAGYSCINDSNTFVGYKAGYSNSTGARNIFLGYNAGYNEAGSDKLYIENSNSATPLIYGDFATDALTINGSLTVTGSFGTYGTSGFADSASTPAMSQNVYYQVTNAANNLFTDGINVGNMVWTGDSTQVNTNGNYEIEWDLSYSGVNTDDYHISLFVNNVEQSGKGEGQRSMTSAKIGSSSGHTILTITAGHWVSLRIKNVANDNDVTFVAGNISITKK